MQLTIIIPVYNCAQYLKSGFEHLKPLYDSSINFEIIYVNDGSADDSLVVLHELQATNKYVQVISQENQGSSGARNTAINVAKGTYIQFLDADDFLEIARLLRLLNRAIAADLDLLGYRLNYYNEYKEEIGERKKQQVQHNVVISGEDALIEGYQPSSICVFLFKTAFLNSNNLRITPKITHMDVEFMTRVMLRAKKVIFVDEVLYHYVQRLGSITKPITIEKKERLLADEIVIANLIRANIHSAMDKQLVSTIEKNYNSVIWNLLWRFISKPKEVSLDFQLNCMTQLKLKELHPIKGALKTNFQRITKVFLNNRLLMTTILKLRN